MGSNSNSTRNLRWKRVLITDIENEFGRELQLALKGEGCVVFTLVRECGQLEEVMKSSPEVIPLLLDLNRKESADEGYKVLSSFPLLDHIINLSGDPALDIIAKAYGSWKIQDFGENKTKPLITKMKDSSARGLIFHSSAGNQNVMSKLKANLNPRYTDSATAQLSTSMRKSFKKLFTRSEIAPSATTAISSTASSSLAQTITSNNTKATEFASVAGALAGGRKSVSPTPSGSNADASTTTPSTSANTPTSTSTSISEKNERIRLSVVKLNRKTLKKWHSLLKGVEKEHLSHLKRLEGQITQMRKREKSLLMSQNAENNAATEARSHLLSEGTASRIKASREARVDREVDKKAEKMRDEQTQKIADEKREKLEKGVRKLYSKTGGKYAKEFGRIREKYMV